MYELQGIFGGDCTKSMDISNAGSTWVGLVAGIVIGAIITWWVYNRQKKTSKKQDELINHILGLEVKIQDELVNQVVDLEKRILSLETKIENMLERRK